MTKDRQLSPLQDLTSVFVLFTLTVHLLCFDASGYSGLSAVKNTVFLIGSGGYVLLMLLLLAESLLMKKLTFRELADRIRSSSWPKRLIFAYALFTVLSALLSSYPITSWLGSVRHEGAVTILLYCFSFLFAAEFFEPKKWMLWVLGISLCLHSLLCILQLAGANPFSLYPGGLTYYDAGTAYEGAFLGTVGNVDLLAAVLSVFIPVLWCLVLRIKGKVRLALLLPLALALFVLIRMDVLAGYVGVFFGSFLCIPVVFPLPFRYRRWMFLALGILLIGAFLIVRFCSIGNGMLLQIHEILVGRPHDSYASGRLFIWRRVLEKIPSHLWVGAGPDTLANANIAFTSYSEAGVLESAAVIDCAHSEYLNVLYHQGIFALLAYVGALAAALIRWFRSAERSPLAAAVGCGVLCYSVQALFSMSQNISAPFFWLALAILDRAADTAAPANRSEKRSELRKKDPVYDVCKADRKICKRNEGNA